MRLIDADALTERINLMIGTGVIYGAEAEAIYRMLHEIKKVPTVDAEPVVHAHSCNASDVVGVRPAFLIVREPIPEIERVEKDDNGR